jgi:Ca2+-binding RTX toxin-like protein
VHGDYGIIDTGANDRIWAGDGNVSILGASSDTLNGGTGHSQFLDAHLGNQLVVSGRIGNETIWGGAGDVIAALTGASVTIAGHDDNVIGGLIGIHFLPSDEFIDGTGGNETILGGLANTTIWGGPHDVIEAGFEGNTTVGGVPTDTILGGPGVAAAFIDGTLGGQSIVGGNAGNETIWGGPGDTINGGTGANVTIGGAAGDTIIGSGSVFGGNLSNAFIDGSGGDESIVGGNDGNETIWGGPGDTIIGGGAGNDTIAGVSGETIVGGAANTFFDATSGNESILAGGGNSTMWGGAHDTVQGVSGGSALIGFAGGNETLWDDGATSGRHDSISTFSQASGDRVSLNSATDTTANVLGTATTDGAGNTTVTLHDGSTITFIGISSVNNTFFTTH